MSLTGFNRARREAKAKRLAQEALEKEKTTPKEVKKVHKTPKKKVKK